MNIIVVGCGKIGTAMIGALTAEGHNVTAVDIRQDVIDTISDMYDVMTVCGSGVDYDTLTEAGAAECRLFVAVTPSDETNILACFLARRMGAHHTVARIENTVTTPKELAFLKQQMNISMFVSPSQLTATELVKMMKLPKGIHADYFARRSFEMIEMKLKEDSLLNGLSLLQMRQKFKGVYLICAVRRGEEVFVPNGNFVLKSGDEVIINASPSEVDRLLIELGHISKESRSVMILGGSHTGYQLAKQLLDLRANVKIIEHDRERCRDLCDALPKAVIINGDGARGDLLNEEGLQSSDAFVALTGIDEENILMAIYASTQNVAKTYAKVDRTEFIDLASKLGLEGQVVEPKKLISDMIVRYARAIENSIGNNVETLYKLMDGKAEALEFNVRQGFKQAGVPLSELNGKLKPNVLIGGIVRGTRSIIPGGSDSIQVGDRVIVLSAGQQMYDLSDILK